MTDQDIEIARLVLDYIKALIWPVTIILLALMFEGEVVELLRRMTKWAGPGFSAEFAEKAKEMEKELEELAETEPTPERPSDNINSILRERGFSEIPGNFEFSRYRALAPGNPNLALAGVRMDLEVMLRILGSAYDLPLEKRFATGMLLKQLTSVEALSPQDGHAARDIIDLCNRAVHGEPIRSKDAVRVIDAAERLMYLLIDRVLSPRRPAPIPHE